MNRIEKIVDAITGEETLIDREETTQEKELRLAAESVIKVIEAERLAAELAKEQILNRLGITSEEAKLLLS